MALIFDFICNEIWKGVLRFGQIWNQVLKQSFVKIGVSTRIKKAFSLVPINVSTFEPRHLQISCKSVENFWGITIPALRKYIQKIRLFSKLFAFERNSQAQ